MSFAAFARSALALSFLALVHLQAQAPQPESKPPTPASPQSGVPVLVELFTSEGCSSCPPADVILQRLDDYQPIPGAQLIVLSEHVTYWDQQGWKDPNSSTAFTDRQSAYESPLGEKEPYTPQFVIDGNQTVSLEKLKDLEDALNKAKENAKIPVRITNISPDPSNPATLRLHIETDANPDKHNADVYVAVALNHVESQRFPFGSLISPRTRRTLRRSASTSKPTRTPTSTMRMSMSPSPSIMSNLKDSRSDH